MKCRYLSVKLAIAILAAFSTSRETATAAESRPIAIVSDLHLRYLSGSGTSVSSLEQVTQPDIHTAATESMLGFLEHRDDISDVVVNGDLFHGDSMNELSWDQKADLIANFLIYLQTRLAKPIHFNFGNHDEVWDFTKDRPSLIPEFTAVLETRLSTLKDRNIFLIGNNSRAIYEYQIQNLRLQISHSPFVKTEALVSQLKRIPPIKRRDGSSFTPGAGKVLRLPELTKEQAEDGLVRVFSDNHTPLIDTENRVYDTGKLTTDINLLGEPPSFLILDQNGIGQLMMISDSGEVKPLDPAWLACNYLSRSP